MLTKVQIKNFRSFVEAEAEISPFTLVLGANGSGKSNFLKFFQATSQQNQEIAERSRHFTILPTAQWRKHALHGDSPAICSFDFSGRPQVVLEQRDITSEMIVISDSYPWMGEQLPIFNPLPEKISAAEPPEANPRVKGDGGGTCQVLDALKTGDREDLFDKVEEHLVRYVPETVKLSLKTVGKAKQIQIREKGFSSPLPANELSEGTRLILCLLTILYQEKPPSLVLLEDIDRGLHPRLFESVAPLIRRIAVDHDINVIATTHNPYLVDHFQDDLAGVLLVEKSDGQSTITSLAERVKGTSYGPGDAEAMPLGHLWYSGLVGGAPQLKVSR